MVGTIIKDLASDSIDKILSGNKHRRHNRFLEALWASLEGKSEKRFAVHFDKISNNEETEEFFYERWRDVSLSCSNQLGPIMVALLYSRIHGEGRAFASDTEEMLFEAAVKLTHCEIVDSYELLKQFQNNSQEIRGVYLSKKNRNSQI